MHVSHFLFLKKLFGLVGNVASNTAQDLLNDENKTFGEAVKENAVKEAKRVMKRSSTIIRGKAKKPKRSLITN